MELLHQLDTSGQFDFWTKARVGGAVDVMAGPGEVAALRDWVEQHDLQASTMISDIEPLIQQQQLGGRNTSVGAGHQMDWTSYHSLDEIYGWMDYLESTYDFCQTESIGQTFEGQEMVLMKVCKGGCGNKPAMWIDSGIHAREWIAPAVSTWMLHGIWVWD